MLNKMTIKTVLIAGALLMATAAGAQEQSQKSRDQNGMAGMDMGDAQKQAGSPEARAANDAMSGNMSDHDMDMSSAYVHDVFASCECGGSKASGGDFE